MKRTLLFRFIGWYFLLNTVIFWVLGSRYLTSILSSPSLFKNFIADYSSWSGMVFVLFFTWVNYLSYMMLLAFIPAMLVFLVAWIKPSIRVVGFASVLLASFSVLVLLTDNIVFSMFKFHLSIVLLKLITTHHLQDVFDFSHEEFLIVLSGVSAVIAVEVLLGWFVWKKINLKKRMDVYKGLLVYGVGGLLFSYCTLMLSMTQNNNLFVQQVSNLPFYHQLLSHAIPDKNAPEILQRFSEQHYTQAIFSRDKLLYPRHPLQCKKPDKAYNIIFIMVDALRFDSLNQDDMPATSEFAANNWYFLQHISAGNSTQAGLFSLFYSIPSSYWTAALEQQVAPIFNHLLAKFGYQVKIIWSSEMHHPPMDKTIYLGFHGINSDGATGNDIGNWDRQTTQKTLDFLKTHHLTQPFFLNLFYDAPHGYCREQSYPALHKPIKSRCSRLAMTNDVEPLPYYNRYLNAVSFIDGQVKTVLQAIKEQGYWDNSIIIFTSDHGQEFNDNRQNYWGHAGNYTPVQVHVPLIVHWPNSQPRRIQYTTSGYDIMPTLFERLFGCTNPISDYSVGDSLLSQNKRPFILAGSYANMGIIEMDRLTVLQSSGGMCVMDKKANILAEQPRSLLLKQALKQMRRFYEPLHNKTS